MKHKKEVGKFLALVAAILVASFIINARQQHTTMPQTDQHPASCPMMQGGEHAQDSKVEHAGHADAMTEMNKRGAKEMGFSQEQTTHHFLLIKDGGAIEVEVNDSNDTAMRDQIRRHLTAIAHAFSEGDFNTPFAIHAQVPSGVPVMKRLRAAINYKFEETDRGGRVRISTNDGEALTAIQDFLRFQIREHHTGDPLEEAR